MVGAVEGGDALWQRLDSEVKRLTANRIKGKHFSEDFVVDRVCTLLSRLREQSDRKAEAPTDNSAASETKPGENCEDLDALRASLDAQRQQLQTLQADVERARTQVQEAKNSRADLDRDWDQEREKQQLAREKHARTWKETALRSQLCQARLKAMEHEGTQLRAALGQPETMSKVWDGLITKLQAELDVANVEVAEAKREHERLSTEILRSEKGSIPVASSEDLRAQTLPMRSEGAATVALPLVSAKAKPALSATSNREMAQVVDTSTRPAHWNNGQGMAAFDVRYRPEPSQSAQLTASATSSSEAPYSTASILNDARRALEKLEQLKVRRVGSLQQSPQVAVTIAAPSVATTVAAGPQVSSLRGPLRQASSLSPSNLSPASSHVPQGVLTSGHRPLLSSGTSPAPSVQAPVQTLSATPAPTQTLSASPSPSARTSTQAQSQSHTPAPQHVAVSTVGATPFRPGMVQVKDFGKPMAKAPTLQRPPSVPPSIPQQRASSMTPPTTGAAKVSSPAPTVRNSTHSPVATSSSLSGNIARATAVADPVSNYQHIHQAARNISLGMPQSSTTAAPMTPDAASRLASMSAARVGQHQAMTPDAASRLASMSAARVGQHQAVMSPDAVTRLASMSAARVGQNQVSSMAPIMARPAAGSLQDYGSARPQLSRPS